MTAVKVLLTTVQKKGCSQMPRAHARVSLICKDWVINISSSACRGVANKCACQSIETLCDRVLVKCKAGDAFWLINARITAQCSRCKVMPNDCPKCRPDAQCCVASWMHSQLPRSLMQVIPILGQALCIVLAALSLMQMIPIGMYVQQNA
jgi:hypothetical protein